MTDPPTSTTSSTGDGGGERRTPSIALEGDPKGKPGFSRARLPARVKAELAAKAQRQQEEEMEKRTATTGNLSTTPQPTAPDPSQATVARSNTPTPSTTTSSSIPAVSRSRLPPVRPSPSPAPSIASSSSTSNTPQKQQRSPKQVPVIEISPRPKSLKPSSIKERDGSQAGLRPEEVRQSTAERIRGSQEPTGLGISLGAEVGSLRGQETEKGKQKETDEMDVSMELDSASDTMTSENGGKSGGEAVKESAAAEYVALCVATLKDLDPSKPAEQAELGQRLVNLFEILYQSHQIHHPLPPPPPPVPAAPSSPGVSLSALEELELRMTARMDKIKKERDGEIESLKAQLAEQDKERILLTEMVSHHSIGFNIVKNSAEEAKREAEEVKKLGQQFDGASIDKRIDDKLALARKPIFEAAAKRSADSTQGAIDQVRLELHNKIQEIDVGFQEWWKIEQESFNRYWSEKTMELDAKIASAPRPQVQQLSISARPASSTSSLPINQVPGDPRRTTSLQSFPSPLGSASSATTSASSRPLPTGPSALRLPPAVPSASRLPSNVRPAQSISAPNLSPQPASPIDPIPTSNSGTEYVTQQQLKSARQKQVEELQLLERSLKDRIAFQKKEFDGKLARLGGISPSGDQGVGNNSRSNSPVATRTTNKTARNGGEIEGQPAENDGRPPKRPRTEGPSAAEIAAVQAAQADVQAAKDAMKRIGDLDTQLELLKGTVESEQTKVANIEKELVDNGQRWEKDKTEIYARMSDGDTRVSRTAQLELKKLSDSTDKSIGDLIRKTGGIETDVERKISGVETSFSKKLSDAETSLARSISTVDNDSNKKVTALETGFETKITAAQQALNNSLSKAEKKLKKNISSVDSRADQLEREKDEIKKRVEGVEEKCAGLAVEITETSDRQRTHHASNQTALNDLRQRVDGKASEGMVQHEISELQRAIAIPQTISPKEILPYVKAELTARHLDDVADDVLRLQAATKHCQDALQQVASEQDRSSQVLDLCRLSLSDLKQESLADNEIFEAFQLGANSRLESLESTSTATSAELDHFKANLDRTAVSIREQHELDVERITEAIRDSKSRPVEDPRLSQLTADVDRLTRAPSTHELESRIQNLLTKLDIAQSTLASQQTTLDAIRSKPTPPASPTLPSTQALSTAVAPTSTNSRAELSSEQKSELLNFLFRSLEELFKRPDSWLRAELLNIGKPLEEKMGSWGNRFETLDRELRSKISDVEGNARLIQTVAQNNGDMLKDSKSLNDHRFNSLESFVKSLEALVKQTLSPSIQYIYTHLQAIMTEAQAAQITPQPQPQSQSGSGSHSHSHSQSQSQLSSSQNGAYQYQHHPPAQGQSHPQRSSSLSNSASRPGSAPNNQSYPTQQSHAPPPPHQQQSHNSSGIAALGQPYSPYAFNTNPNFPLG
ncbi:hypothetical protein JCM5353_007596 [Sporobolomyces roseus]